LKKKASTPATTSTTIIDDEICSRDDLPQRAPAALDELVGSDAGQPLARHGSVQTLVERGAETLEDLLSVELVRGRWQGCILGHGGIRRRGYPPRVRRPRGDRRRRAAAFAAAREP
jgi:hypothetical protein